MKTNFDGEIGLGYNCLYEIKSKMFIYNISPYLSN